MGKTVQIAGLDIAKHVFQVHGADRSGKAELWKWLRGGAGSGVLKGRETPPYGFSEDLTASLIIAWQGLMG